MWLLIAFIGVPLIEIALFIQIGGAIGLWSTLAIVVLTAVLGTFMVKQQGAMAISDLRNQMTGMKDPTEALANGAMILFSGALLLTPGFFTDAMGFALLIPGIRKAVFNYLRQRVKVQSFAQKHPAHHSQGGGPVIDGEFEDLTAGPDPQAEPRRTQGPSGWTDSEQKD